MKTRVCKNRQPSMETVNQQCGKYQVLVLASVASMIDQFNMSNIRLLQEMGCEVHVACNFMEGNTCDKARIRKLKRELQKKGVIWHQWDCPRKVYAIGKCIKACEELWSLTGRYPYDLIYCHSPIGSALARIMAHLRKIPVIYTAHGFHFYKGAPVQNWLLYYPLEKLLAYDTNLLITVNKEDYVFAKRNFSVREICRIPGVGIDTGRFLDKNQGQEFRRRYGIAPDALLLLSVGELSVNKNHRVVLEALAGLRNREIYYMICGQGRLQNWLMDYAEHLNVARQVRLPGYVENVEAAYLAADIFVFPSKREGMPVALMEAMAAGLPCIVSDIRGNRELIKERWLRFQPECVQELTYILSRFLKDQTLRESYGRYNRRQSQKYDLSVVEERMKKIYWQQLKNGRL